MHLMQYFISYIYKGVMLNGLPVNVFFLSTNEYDQEINNHRSQTDLQIHEEETQNKDRHTTLKQPALFLRTMIAEL